MGKKQKAASAPVVGAAAADVSAKKPACEKPDETVTDTSAFAALGVSQESCAVLGRLGFSKPTPVQEACLPLFRGHKDVAVDACTGSGKTLAFVVPLIDRLRALETPLKKHQVGAIVVAPTRELAKQIMDVAAPFVQSVPGLQTMLLVGGTDPAQDVSQFKESGGHVLIGTPGRLHDIMGRTAVMDTKALEVLVLDEADRLLDMGFQRQLDAIMARLPKQRRTGLFSATQTEAVEALARAGLRNPVRVAVAVAERSAGAAASGDGSGEQKTPNSLSIFYMRCASDAKMAQLVHFLQAHKSEKIIVYFLTCAVVDFYLVLVISAAAHLPQHSILPAGRSLTDPACACLQAVLSKLKAAKGLSIYGLHGRMKQAAREKTLGDFTGGTAGVLLATDVAARGLDIPQVHWVVQVDPPQDPSAFVHRVGRTARMGQSGNALAFLLPNEEPYVDFLRLRKVPLVEMDASGDVPEVLTEAKKMAETDRDVMEKGTKAFVSYVRGYKEHHCRFIFRFSELHLGELATAFAVLRLPKMSETKRAKTLADFVASEVDPATVPFKDKAREKQRKKLDAARAKEAEDSAEAKKRHQQQQQQRQKAAPAVDPKEKRLTAEKRRLKERRMELDELNDDYAMLRKVKKGKMSEREFDIATGFEEDLSSANDAPHGGRHLSLQAQGMDKKKRSKKKQKKAATKGSI